MRAVLALLAFILVFFALNVDRLVTINWWKRRRIEAIAYRQAGSAVIGRRLGMNCGDASIKADDSSAGVATDPDLIQRQWVRKGKFRDPASVFRGQILTLMAGGEAEREFGFTPKRSNKDNEEITSMLQCLAESDAGYEERLRKKA